MDKLYWSDFYSNKRGDIIPSLFAKFVLNNYLKKGESLIELGCGNGRDAVFFSDNEIQVLAVDQCSEDILRLISQNQSLYLDYLCADFTNLGDRGKFDNIYSRFTLHSITEKEENNVLEWSLASLNPKGHFFIEVRGHLNELYKKGDPVPGDKDAYVFDGHYRRFLNNSVFCEKLNKHFNLIYNEEKKGFSPFKGEDQVFLRIVCEKK